MKRSRVWAAACAMALSWLVVGCGSNQETALISPEPGSLQQAAATNDPPYIYGIHDEGGTALMPNNKGWIVFTVIPDDYGRDYRGFSNNGYGVIVRLNHGYEPNGTLPRQADVPAFAQRSANYVSRSPGVHYWIIGNEPNLPREWPGGASGEPITPSRYISAYNTIYDAIKAVAPDERIAPAPSGTYAPPDEAKGIPGYVEYWRQVITGIPASKIQAHIMHTYTHGCDPSLITSTQKFTNAPYTHYHFHFRAYRDYMAVIPTGLRSLPVLITETDQTENSIWCATRPPANQAWLNTNNGWVREAYREINDWNQSNTPKVRSLVLFRWNKDYEGSLTYGFSDLQGVKDDFSQALAMGYRWDGGGGGTGNNATLDESQSSVPGFLMPGEIRSVSVRANNTGGTTWSASTAYRLSTGSASTNSMRWSSFPVCGGYSNSNTDARAYLCQNVAPGGYNTFQWDVRAPTSGTSATLMAQMVRDGYEFFGEKQAWPVRVGTAYCGTACTQCILDARTDLLPFYQSSGWDTSCGNRDNIVNNWCSGLDPTACNSLKTGACSAFCNSCRCSGGTHLGGQSIDPNGTFCDMRVCGTDSKIYQCTSTGWSSTGATCK